MRVTGQLTILIIVLGGSLIPAQESVLSFDELDKIISVGESVRITDKSGIVIKGEVKGISHESLLLKGRKSNQLDQGKLDLHANSIRF